MRLAVILMLLPLPVFAQDWIDYGLLMRENADRVETMTDANGMTVQSLNLGDGVLVQCSDGNCYGTDAGGALGCTFAIMADMTALNATCPGNLDAGEEARLKAAFDRMGRFIEENAVPPRPAGYAQGLLEKAMADQAGEDEAARQKTCERLKPGGDLAEMLGYLSGEDFPGEMNRVLATPRLPVMNPCL
ncbi:hypothetical protein [Pseudogemmobacter bohemicus]|uniref:hypothetical protein n=1 Tax=Pseudogemmobacter bohemicus TaxID=2250708 RepID=UPI000DD30C67|nr:hypothetical protein [Pseudogemmobacter bohemicus]